MKAMMTPPLRLGGETQIQACLHICGYRDSHELRRFDTEMLRLSVCVCVHAHVCMCVCLCVCACMRLHAQRSGPVAMNQIDWRDKNGARNKMRPTSQMFNKVNKFNFTVNKSRKQQLAVSVLHFQGEDSLLKSIMMA